MNVITILIIETTFRRMHMYIRSYILAMFTWPADMLEKCSSWIKASYM